MNNRILAKELLKIAKMLVAEQVASEPGEYKNFSGKIDLKRCFGHVSNANFSISGDGEIDVWESGTWEDGALSCRIWKNGTFKMGSMFCQEWEKGTWQNGTWRSGTWKNGTWKSGGWLKGIWENGTWETGTWVNGSWRGGTWKNGNWKWGVWWDGTWENGNWRGFRWENGIWRKGTWERGDWYGGRWENGTWKGGTWWDGVWKNGDWKNGDWRGGVWEDGVWESGEINRKPSPTSPNKLAKSLVGMKNNTFESESEFEQYYSKDISWLTRNGFKKKSVDDYEKSFNSFKIRVQISWYPNLKELFYARLIVGSIPGGLCLSTGKTPQEAIHEAINELKELMRENQADIQRRYDYALKEYNENMAPYKNISKELDDFERKI